ncbi:MAG: acyl-CoA dehydrogenase [Rhodospirillaceae bacterium]|jgi:acyl-CoA dehydrogenase|nr:acyl-CoA dehydrogenase [Rhodospirillaceae bacterium]MBT4690328.1 acyl-CoA dehydrogenase [Rhodospirillaceae bacterium]MBT5079312.1 acyl-CoA dehydrogenase [Rhodospirillaceae bacterium]MBT5525788.1 acyl-CoA dehydrogenase [Rhodospirillaceae bacterium]MBT5880159.1 acyl-CoA dehydrogenase [Rhodospirillaceae bacterium]
MNVLKRIDDSLDLPEEERLILDAVSALCRDRLQPNAAAYDLSGEFPWDNVHAINNLGLNGMFIPDEYGGTKTSYVSYLATIREMAKACAATAMVWGTTFHAVKPVIDFASKEQKQRLLPNIAKGGLVSLCITEPTAGSDATGMKTKFTPDGDDIIITGGKTFITQGDQADLFVLFGKWSEIENDKAAISVVLLEKGTPGLSVVGKEDKMGQRACSTVSLAFDNIRVPRANLMCEPGDGLKILFSALNKSRPSIAAHALGIARVAFEDAVAYINQRQQSGRNIIEFQGIQFMLADMATDLALCESWLWRVGRMIDAGEDDIGIEASMLKMRASDLAMHITTEAVQLHGGYGYCRDYPVERYMRDAKITQIYEGTNQIHRQLIGRSFIEK